MTMSLLPEMSTKRIVKCIIHILWWK